MKTELLDVVTCVSNPLLWKSRINLYRAFQEHMLASGVRLTTIEAAYGERPFEIDLHPDVNNVHVRAKTMVWNKESLLNLAISRLPDDFKYVAWIDGDILFRDKDWAAKTVDALQLYDVVQPWSHCYDLGPNGEHLNVHTSFAKLFFEGKPIVRTAGYEFAHPGYAWAATREAINHLGGLIEVGSLGAGDHHMAMALASKGYLSYPGAIHANYKAEILAWQKRADTHIRGNLGYVPGTIEHSWHGSKVKRAYVDRWSVLTKHKFDPLTDVQKNSYGVVELSCNKPGLRRDMDHYFRNRNEDQNSIN